MQKPYSMAKNEEKPEGKYMKVKKKKTVYWDKKLVTPIKCMYDSCDGILVTVLRRLKLTQMRTKEMLRPTEGC